MGFVRRGVSVVFLVACATSCSSSEERTAPARETYMGLETPVHGFQLRSEGDVIPAGADVEICEVGELPGVSGGEFFMGRIELANGDASHHLIMYVATPGSEAEAALKAKPIGHKEPCSVPEMVFGEGLENLGGIQRPYGEMVYPEGIARRLHAGQRFLWDYHYYNTSEEPVTAQSAMNIHLTDRVGVKQLLGGVSAFNFLIDTPPGASRAFKAECRFDRDMIVGGITRHTHRWGGDYKAWFAGGPRDGEHFWTSTDFEEDIDHPFDEPLLVRKGDGFAYECSFHNTEQRALRWGTSARDEMCNLFMATWDPDGAFEPVGQTCNIVWADETGLGHTAAYERAFPPSAESDAALCKGSATDADACTTCACDSCASTTLRCFADTDCRPIVECVAPANCDLVVDEHSSGLGLAQQLSECVRVRCDSACGGRLAAR